MSDRKTQTIKDLFYFCFVGILIVEKMVDVNGKRIDKISFGSISIRNRGTMIAKNGRLPRLLIGKHLHIFPGGILKATHLLAIVQNLTVDVMGKVQADGTGYYNKGQYSDTRFQLRISHFY